MSLFTFSVVSHGHGKLLCDLLSDLDAQSALAGAVVIVTLNIAEVFDATAYPRLSITTVFNRTPRGFGANHNAAFARCTTPWFVVLNPDLRLIKGEPFTALIRLAVTLPGLGVIAPRIDNRLGEIEDSVRSNLTPWSIFKRHVVGRRQRSNTDTPSRRGETFYWLAGMCMVFDSIAYRAVGGFDERFFLYGEDYDICARLFDQGYAIATDLGSGIVHDAQRNSHRSLRHLRWHGTSILQIWLSPVFWRVTLGLRRRGTRDAVLRSPIDKKLDSR